jgi:trimethylamine:corrinoid methyltransferase-like protein
MAQNPLLLRREPLLSGDQLARIEEATLDLLEQVGIAVLDKGLRARVRALGYREREGRVLIGRRRVAEFLSVERRRNGDRFRAEVATPGVPDQEVRVWLNKYPPNVHEVGTDLIVPFTTDRLIEATKLVDVLAERGLVGSPPGCPTDVPPRLQGVVQYWVGATYSRQGRWPPDVRSVEDCPYVMEMAEVLGNPIRQPSMWVASPLTLGGDSLACVMAFAHKVSSVHVGSMPTAGCTAPMHAGDALAVAAAEVIGPAVLVQDALDLPVRWTAGLWPVDFVSMALVVGSPEQLLSDLMSNEVNAYLHGTPCQPACTCFHTMAKIPGPQACAEKASSMTMGALLGARRFGVAGTLSLDEVFSAEQLLYDLEIRDHV